MLHYSCKRSILGRKLLRGSNTKELLFLQYLANQKYREFEGYYLYGEYSHGIFGRIEFYQNKLKAKSPLELIQMLNLIIEDYQPDRRSFCLFFYKQKFRKCHKQAFEELSSIKPFLYYDGKEQLIPFFNKNPFYKLPRT